MSEKKRSRVVLYSALGVGLLAALLIGLLAASKPVAQGSNSSPLIGRSAPPIDGPALGGTGRYSLSDFLGKWVVVNFSASWCVPCRQETPQLQELTVQHQTPAVVLAVSYDPTDETSLASYLKSSRATWPAVIDPGADVSYGVSGIPESYLVDPGGKVVARFLGGITASEVNAAIRGR